MLDQALFDKLRRLLNARQNRDDLKQQLKSAEDEYRELEAEVWDLFEDSALKPPYKIDLGDPWGTVRFHNRTTNYGRVIDKEAFREWLEENNLTETYTENKAVMQRVNEDVRDALEQGKTLPPGVDFYPKRFVSITREKGG